MCADDRVVYLAEAPLRGGHASHGGHGGRLTARDPRNGKVSRTLNGGGNALSCLLATSDGHLWSGSYDGLVRVSRRGGQALHEARAHSSIVHALAEAAAPKIVFSAGSDFLVRAWSSSLVPLRTLRAHTAAVHCVAAPGMGMASSAATTPTAWGHSAVGDDLAEELWSGGDDGVIHVWGAAEASGFAHACTHRISRNCRLSGRPESGCEKVR